MASDLKFHQSMIRDALGQSGGMVEEYCEGLRQLTEIIGQDVRWIVSNNGISAARMMARCAPRGVNEMTDEELDAAHGMTLSVLATVRSIPGGKDDLPDANTIWTRLIEGVIEPIRERRCKGEGESKTQGMKRTMMQMAWRPRDPKKPAGSVAPRKQAYIGIIDTAVAAAMPSAPRTWAAPDASALSIECPRCRRTLTSSDKHPDALARNGQCGETK